MKPIPVNLMKSTESAGEAFLALGYAPPAFRFARVGKVNEIKRIVAAHFGISVIEMDSARRDRSACRPRQIAMYMAKSCTTLSLPDIGRRFGGKDHTTVIHGVRKIEALASESEAFSDMLAEIKEKITSALGTA